jgi:hypothetical protein
LIASGFIAGRALMGVVSAILKFAKIDWFMTGWNSTFAEPIAIIPYVAIIVYLIIASMKIKQGNLKA